jgi:hypothetical protein
MHIALKTFIGFVRGSNCLTCQKFDKPLWMWRVIEKLCNLYNPCNCLQYALQIWILVAAYNTHCKSESSRLLTIRIANLAVWILAYNTHCQLRCVNPPFRCNINTNIYIIFIFTCINLNTILFNIIWIQFYLI